MSPDILAAIKNIADFGSNNLSNYSTEYLIRINAVGEQLEFYIRDAICSSFRLPHREKEARYRSVFSLLGNQSNPPDMFIGGGDAFEIKKIQSLRARANPVRVFSYIYTLDASRPFSLAALMTRRKFNSFPEQSIASLEEDDRINLETVNVKNPNNPQNS